MTKQKEVVIKTESVSIEQLQKLYDDTQKELEQEKAKNIVLAKQKTRATSKQHFRIKNCSTHNNFHLSFNQLFVSESLAIEFKSLILTQDESEVVFKDELRTILKARILEALQLLEKSKE